MDMHEIDELIEKLMKKGITEFELEREGFRIRICKSAPTVVSAPPQQEAAVSEVPAANPVPAEISAGAESDEDVSSAPGSNNHHVITSPMVGTFYRAPSPGAKPYVEIGDHVRKGQTCCIVEAMKLMNEIAIDVDGIVAAIHAENAQPVEYGEPLLSIAQPE